MSSTHQLQQTVLELLTKEMQLPVPDVTTDLLDEGILDSLVFVDLIARLEEAFAFEIDLTELDIDQFRTVAQMADFVVAGSGSADSSVVNADEAAAKQD